MVNVENTERAVEIAVEWQKRNPEKRRANVRNRTALRKAADGRHTSEQIIGMLHQQHWRCIACDEPIVRDRHIDHIMPLILGGSNDISNLQGLCPTCNMRKHDTHPLDWAMQIGRPDIVPFLKARIENQS